MADTAIVILTGQSLNAWRGSTRFLETGWSGARQFVGGGAALEMDFAAINETETPDHNDTASVVTQAETTGGQSPIAGIASALSGAGFTRVYLYSAAIGSRAYDAQFGSGIFQSVVTGVQRMIELAAGQGDTDPDIFFYHAHGEGDAVGGRTAEQYRDDSILWIQRLQLLAAQYLERPAYRAPVFFSMPIQNKTPTGGSDASNDIAIKHGIKLAADSADVSEVYILPTYSTVILPESDLVHPDEASFVRRGEYVGFLIKDYLAGTVYEPLRITSVTRSGATVTVQFTHDIVRDATENWGGNLNGVDGFEYFDNGSEIAISGVVYSGDTATITLNSTPAGSDAQQVLRLGMQVTATSAAPNQANICGTVIRKTGAGVASVTNVSVTHHDFAIQEEISGFPYDYTPPSPGGTIGDVTIGGTIGDLSTVAFDATEAVGDVTIGSTIGDLSTVAFDATQAVGDVTIGGTIGDLSTVAFDATQAVGDVTIGGTIGDLSTAAFNASAPTEDGVSLDLATTVVESLRTSLQGGAFALYAGDPESAGVELVSGGIPGSITAASDGAISFTPAASHAVGISESQTPTHWQMTGNVGAGSPTWSGAFGDAFTSEDIADGGLVTFGEVTIAVSDLAGAPDPEPGETGTWESRSAGAHFATRWDVQADVDASYAQTFTENISLETRARFSGDGALRMAIPNDDGPGFGAWISPLFPDEASRAMQLGEEIYISMAVYTPRDLLQQDFGGTFTGFKNMIVSNIDTSNPVFELVLQNTWSGGVVRGYHQDGVASAVNWESDVPEGVVSTAFTGSDRNWQPSRDADANPLTGNSPDGDAWTQQEQDRARYAGLFGTQTDYRDVNSPDPLTNAVLYQPDDWVHILQRIKIDDVDETSCEWQVWAWHEGLDGWQELVNIPDATLGAGATDTDGTGLNGTWITFYMTGVNPDAGRRNTYAVVDEYIVSPTAIAAPASAGRPAQIAAHGLRPATWSDAVSVTGMESSWTDASGFDSSVFLTGLYWEKYRRAAYTIGGVSGGQGGEFYLIRYDDDTGTWSKHLQGTDPRTDQPNWKAHGWSNMCLDEERQRLLMANRRWLGTGNGYVATIDLHYWDLTVADFDATYGTDTAINGAPTLMQATAITSSLTPYMCFEMQQYADKLVLYNPFGSGTCYHFDAADGANQTSLGTAPVTLGLEPISAWERATDRVLFIGGATGGKSCFAVNDDGTYDNTIPDVPCTQSTLQCGGTQHDDAFSHPATGELVVYASIDRAYYVLRGGVWGTLPNNDAPAVVDAGGTGNPSRSILHCPTPYGQGTALVAITRAGFETRMLRLPIEEP
jgi:hypothetical protein